MSILKKVYPVGDLALLLGLSAQAINKKLKRENWKGEKRHQRGGGHSWLLSSMPEATQVAIRLAEEREALAAHKSTEVPSIINSYSNFNTLSHTPKKAILDDKRRYKALAKGDIIQLYLNWQRKFGATVVQKKMFIEAYLGGAWADLLKEFGTKISWKSIERWKNEQKRQGSVLALADKRGIACKGTSLLTKEHRMLILGHILNPNSPRISQCARKIQLRCRADNLYVPSEPTIRRFVNKYSSECFDEWTLWRQGKKAWTDKCAISLLRDWNLVEVGDIVIADGHTLNFETLDPDTGKPKRMTLLLFYDGASNHPLGWEIMPTENTACISSAFRRTCLLLGKFPRVVYLDNGKAFRSKFFKGTTDFDQAGFMGLYRDLGCEVIHAWPYHGQSKPIERFFGTFHEMEIFMPSYTGNDIAHKPARMNRGETMHRKLYEKMGCRPLTLDETHTAIAMWFCEYVNRPQRRTHLHGQTPAEIFQAGIGAGVDERKLTLMMLQKKISTISKDGIRHHGKLYWHEALASRRHPVLVRYDEQLSPQTVLVYDTDGNFLCEARDRAYFKIAYGLHPAARVLGTAEQVQDLSEAIALKKGQEKLAGQNLRIMLDAVVLPEAKKMQDRILMPASNQIKSFPITTKHKSLSSAEIARIEALKEQVRLEVPEPYKPAALMRFKDELSKYEYLFNLVHEQHIELITQDAVWMQTFEQSEIYQRTYKGRYDARLELYAFREQQAS